MRFVFFLLLSVLSLTAPAQAQDTRQTDVLDQALQTYRAARADLLQRRIDLANARIQPGQLAIPTGDDGYRIESRDAFLDRLRAASLAYLLAGNVQGADPAQAARQIALIFDLPEDLVVAATRAGPAGYDRETLIPFLAQTSAELSAYVSRARTRLDALDASFVRRLAALDQHIATLEDLRAKAAAPPAPAPKADSGAGYRVNADAGGWLYDQINLLGTTKHCGGGRGCCAEYRDDGHPYALYYYAPDNICFSCTPPFRASGSRSAISYPECFVAASQAPDIARQRNGQ